MENFQKRRSKLILLLFFSIFILLNKVVIVNANGISACIDTSDAAKSNRPASVPESFIIGTNGTSTQIYRNDGELYIEPHYKLANDDKPVYCIATQDAGVSKNDVYTYLGEITDPGLIYIAKNGYPYATFSDIASDHSAAHDTYSATQLAFWLYNHEIWGDTYAKYDIVNFSAGNNWNRRLIRHSLDLLAKAKDVHAREWSSTGNKRITPSMGTPTVSSTNLTLSGGELISQEISVPLTAISSYTVSVNNGAVVVDSTGAVKNTFASGEKFRVKLASSGSSSVSITVTITVSSTMDRAYAYKNTTNPAAQNLLYNVVYSTPVNDSKSFVLNYTYTPTSSRVSISKQDATTGKELPGAKLRLETSTGSLVEEWTSTNTPHVVTLQPGTYRLTETIAPNGYKKSEEVIEFTLNSDGTTTPSNIVMKNRYIEVPATALNKPTVMLISSLVLGVFGVAVIYVSKKELM